MMDWGWDELMSAWYGNYGASPCDCIRPWSVVIGCRMWQRISRLSEKVSASPLVIFVNLWPVGARTCAR